MSGPSDLKVTFNELPNTQNIMPHEVEVISTSEPDNISNPAVMDLEESGPGFAEISILKQLENQLIIEYTKASGNEVDPLGLSQGARDAYMQEILPCIKEFHGQFDRKDPNKADSPIILSTYYPFTKIDPKTKKTMIDPESGLPVYNPMFKCIKVKMTWQFEVNFNGAPKTLQYSQFIQTPSLLPMDPGNFDEIDVAKIKGVLSGKVTRQLLKKAFFDDKYEMVDMVNGNEAIDRKVFLACMRKAPVYHLTHNPGAAGVKLVRSLTTSIQKGELPCYTEVDFIGHKMSVSHDPQRNVKGRKLVYFDKDHKKLPADKKAEAAYSKYLKVYIPSNPDYDKKAPSEIDKDGTSYNIHVYEQGILAVIDDPELNALSDLSKSRSPNILKELEQKQKELGEQEEFEALKKKCFGQIGFYASLKLLEKAKYREYEQAVYYKNLKKFRSDEKQFRENMISSIQDGAYNQGFFMGCFIDMTVGVQEFFSEGSALQKMLSQQAESMDKQLEDLKQAEVAKDWGAKTALLKDLENTYKQMEQFKNYISKFEESIDNMKLARDHISQIGVLEEDEYDGFMVEHFLEYSAESIQQAEEKLEIYTPIIGAGPKLKEIKSILMANNMLG